MDELPEVKRSGKQGHRTWVWLMGAVLLCFGVGSWFVIRGGHDASQLARLPTRERNLVVFDAALRLLKAEYFDPKLFEKPEWQEYETHWRQKAAESEGGILLYKNVLDNLAARFPDSHLGFSAPPLAPGTVVKPMPAGKPASADKPASKPAADNSFDLAAVWDSGPGFDAAMIRRHGYFSSVVADVQRGSPAERAGITPGWALRHTAIDVSSERVKYTGTFVPLTSEMARAFERSAQLPAGEAIREFNYEVLPRRAALETRTLEGGATYLRFDHFNEWSLVSRALDVIDEASPKGLVLDLRRNSGGRVLNLERVIGRLLGRNVEYGRARGRLSEQPMTSILLTGDPYAGPLVVLIGPMSESAAEITAAAMQDHKRGLVIGRSTSGSVVSAKRFDLPDGGTMIIPVRDFVRSDGRRIEGAGVEPDIWVLPTLEDVRAGRDPVLERALLVLAGKSEES